MVEVVPFRPEHLQALRVQACQRAMRDATPAAVMVNCARLPSFTALAGGEPLACFGMVPIWPGRAICWAYLAEDIGRRMTAVVRAMRAAIAEHQPARLEMDTPDGFEEGHRMARLLGFRKEVGGLAHYYPDGAAASLYARIKA